MWDRCDRKRVLSNGMENMLQRDVASLHMYLIFSKKHYKCHLINENIVRNQKKIREQSFPHQKNAQSARDHYVAEELTQK